MNMKIFLKDTTVLFEIINNSIRIDTSLWEDSELPKAILVSGRYESVGIDQVYQKFKPKKRREKKILKKIVDKYNNADNGIKIYPSKKVTNSYSRPVFDNSNQYCVIGYNYPVRGHGISLYHLKNSTWTLIGDIESWAY